MRIRIQRQSGVSIRQQLSEQIVFLIASGKLKAGEALPSVRELAMRHKIHPNTVSEAYKDLVRRFWIKRQHGKKMIVRALDEPLGARVEDLDDLIDVSIRTALERGHTLQELHQRLEQRLLIQPPERVLIVEEEPGLRRILFGELSEMLRLPVTAVGPEELTHNPGQLIGALVVSLPGRARHVVSLLPKGHPFLSLTPSPVDEHLRFVNEQIEASVIGIASVSPWFLQSARGLIGSVAGSEHAIEHYLIDEDPVPKLSHLDLLFCDSIVWKTMRARKAVRYCMTSRSSIEDILSRIRSGAGGKQARAHKANSAY